MAATTHACEIFIMVGDDGNYVTASSKENLYELWEEEIGETIYSPRIIRAVFHVETPAPQTLEVTVPARDGAVSLKVDA